MKSFSEIVVFCDSKLANWCFDLAVYWASDITALLISSSMYSASQHHRLTSCAFDLFGKTSPLYNIVASPPQTVVSTPIKFCCNHSPLQAHPSINQQTLTSSSRFFHLLRKQQCSFAHESGVSCCSLTVSYNCAFTIHGRICSSRMS